MSIRQYIASYFSDPAHVQHSANGRPPGAVSLASVTKRFRRRTTAKKSYRTMKSDLVQWLSSENYDSSGYFKALDNVSFDIAPGSSIGIIGRNGSGKSTLLKLIAGIYLPDDGEVGVHGRVSALIELGAGFHPDFTGRENVFLGGIMYGLSKRDISDRFDAIVRYAELAEVIDDPVRTYSSGMYMRLGFSLAIHTDPDILLVDEVLAVGDAPFINRCQDTISEFKRQGKTIIFVTHDLSSVARWCDEALWLDRGVLRDRGEPREVIDRYLAHVEEGEEAELVRQNEALEAAGEVSEVPSGDARGRKHKRWGGKEVELLSVTMLDQSDHPKWLFHSEEVVTIEVRYRLNAPVDDLSFGIGILRADGTELHGTNTDIDDERVPLPEASAPEDFPLEGTYRYCIKRLGLLEDSYFLDIAAHRSDGYPYDYHHRLYKFSVRSLKRFSGMYVPDHTWTFEPSYEVRSAPKADQASATDAARLAQGGSRHS
ncbi:MAG: ABC transporter ATP-binding protein [Bdellovibrionales bacterium]|nr:ABC transporter ATP-binding protein [Bdellovibrionales bacterium]